MWIPRRSDLLLVAVAAAVAGGIVLVNDGDGLPEWLFGTVLFSLLGLLGRLAVDAARSARSERLRARTLGALHPDDAARRAVEEERLRLAGEVQQSIHDSMRAVSLELDSMDVEAPVPALRRIHALTRRTASELRRQLGLLRDPGVVAHEQPPDDPTPPTLVSRGALFGGLLLALLAGVETTAYLLTEGPEEWLPWSALVAALAGSTIALRALPELGILALATLIVLGSLIGAPVTGGFWMVITPGVLVWSLVATAVPRGPVLVRRAGVLAVLGAALVWALGRDDPSNLGVLLVLLGIAAVGGSVVGVQRHLRASAEQVAVTRERELGDAARGAVRAERVLVARELHDVVSHAVGVIAMQAAAAEMSWPKDPEAVSRAVAVIRRTTAATLADLDQLPDGPEGTAPVLGDLRAVVERVRQAGTPVELTVIGGEPAHPEVVHRVVQEALTNALRHAPGANVVVSISTAADGTHVSVRDSGPGPGDVTRQGYGLVGLAERVALVGGSFETGPDAGGRGFRVSATVPHGTTVGLR